MRCRRRSRCGRRRCSAAAWSPGSARSTAPALRVGDSVCVIGCGGVGLQVIAGARLAGAGTIVAVDRDRGQARAGAAPGRDARGAARPARTSSREVLAVTGGGVEHAFEVVGSPVTIRQAWDVLRPGGTATVVGLAPVGVEVSLPAIELPVGEDDHRQLLRLDRRRTPRSASSCSWCSTGGSTSATSSRT